MTWDVSHINYNVVHVLLLRHVAGAGRGKFEDVNEEPLVGIALVVSKHSMVDKLLGALALVAWSQKATRRVRRQTRLDACRLGVVVDAVDDHPPITVDVSSPSRHGILHVRRTQVT